MSVQQIDKDKILKSNKKSYDLIEIDLIEIVRKIIGIRKTLYKVAGIGGIIGIIVSLSIPKEYTVQVTLSPEMGGNKSGSGIAGLAASFLGSSVSTGDGVDALNISLSSDIVSSTPFLLELLDINVPSSDGKNTMTLDTYLDEQSSPWWNYVIGLPSKLVGEIKSLFTAKDIMDVSEKQTKGGVIELTKEINSKINILRNNIMAAVNTKTAITSVSITLQNPKIAAVVADSVVHKLQECIVNYRISKAKDDCAYLEKLFKERQMEYYVAQKKYANYIDSHDNLILQSVRTEQERLQNDMSIAYQVYSQVANQLQVARAKVQEMKPVFVVVEPAVVPLYAAGMGMTIYIITFVFLAVMICISWLLIGQLCWKNLKNKI